MYQHQHQGGDRVVNNNPRRYSSGSKGDALSRSLGKGNRIDSADVADRKSFRILVVDDSAMTRKMLVKTLKAEVLHPISDLPQYPLMHTISQHPLAHTL